MVLLSFPHLDANNVKPVFEFRERFERRVDRDFDSTVRDNRSDLFSRYRVGAEFPLNPEWKAMLQYQYAHDLAWTPSRNFSTWNSDAYQAYAETKAAGTTFTLGRQRLVLGSQRLIGSLEWSNTGRSFDAIRVRNGNWDAWAGKVAVANPKPRDARVFGLTNSNPLGLSSLIYKHDKVAAGKVDVTTFDHVWSKAAGSLGFDLEGALQTGKTGGKDLEAWAFHARITKSFALKTSGYLEFNAASGGSSAGKVRTFDNLYPTNHDKYGIMDLQGWRNMNEIALGVEQSPMNGMILRGSWHAFNLQDSKDAWYGAAGAPNKRVGGTFVDPTGASGREVGQELDLELAWTVRKDATLQAGVGIFNPGDFVKNLAGTSDRQTWGFISFQRKF